MEWDMFGETRKLTKLIGGFHCELTASEANKWHEFVTQSEAWKAYMALTDEANAAEINKDASAYVACRQRLMAVEAELYQLAKAWHALVIQPAIDARKAKFEKA